MSGQIVPRLLSDSLSFATRFEELHDTIHNLSLEVDTKLTSQTNVITLFKDATNQKLTAQATETDQKIAQLSGPIGVRLDQLEHNYVDLKGSSDTAIARLSKDSAELFGVPTIAALKSITELFNGKCVRVYDSVRGGVFKWLSGDKSQLVSLDPDQGLYVPPSLVSSGVLGVWVRLVQGNVYLSDWWGIVDGFVDTALDINPTGVTIFQARAHYYAINLLPPGAIFQHPAGTITMQSGVSIPTSITLQGTRGKTIITTTPGSTMFNDAAYFFRPNASNSRITGYRFINLRTTQGQISPCCIAVAGGVDPSRKNNPVSNIEIDHCEFENVSAPIIVYESSWTRSDKNGNQFTTGVFIHDNKIRNCDYEYTSLYGVSNVWYYNNDIECDSIPGPYREFYGLRIIGSRNVYVFSNRIIGPANYARPDARAFNIKSSIGPLTEVVPPILNRVADQNINIYNNDVRNWPIMCDISGYINGVYVRKNKFTNNPLPTEPTLRGCFANFQGNDDVRDVIFEDNTIVGGDALFYIEGGYLRDISFIRNTMRCAGTRPGSQPSEGFANVRGVTHLNLLKIIGNTIEWLPTDSAIFQFNNTPEGFFAQVWGNVCPERTANYTDSTVIGFGGEGVKGKVQTAPSGPLYDATTLPNAQRVPDGTNGVAAPGTWAALTSTARAIEYL